MLSAFGHRVAIYCDLLGVVGSNLTIFNLEPTTPNMLQHIATRWPNARNMLRPKMLRTTCWVRLATLLRQVATGCDMLRHVGCCWLKFNQFQTWANNAQHVATQRNTVVKRTQHVTHNNVAIYSVDMLRLFGRSFRQLTRCIASSWL